MALSANADINLPLAITTLELQQSNSYQVNRIYAGQLENKQDSRLGFQTSGIVQNIYFQEGDEVNAGDTLISLDNSELLAEKAVTLANLASAKANRDAAQSRWELAMTTYKRHQELVEQGHTSAQRLDELKFEQKLQGSVLKIAQTQVTQAEANLELIVIKLNKTNMKAPFSGIIQDRLVDEGAIIAAGQVAIRLVESQHLEARIGIPLNMVKHLNANDSYEFQINGMNVQGYFRKFLPRIDSSTGTVTALFDLEPAPLFAGSLTELKLQVAVQEQGFWIPISALSESQRGLWSVFVVSDEEKVESRLVEIIHRGDDGVYVRGTLSSGETLVRGGTDRVVPGQVVARAH